MSSRKKYDSSDDEQIFHAKVARKKSSKKLDFQEEENEIKKSVESNKEIENHANANVDDVKKACSVAKKFEETESIAVGMCKICNTLQCQVSGTAIWKTLRSDVNCIDQACKVIVMFKRLIFLYCPA